MVLAHDPECASFRALKRNKSIKELEVLAFKWISKLDGQDTDARKGKSRPMSDSGAKEHFYHAVKDASLANISKDDLKGDVFSYEIEEARKKYLEMINGKLLLDTITDLAPSEVVSRYKSLDGIERCFRDLKSEILK
jgi:transposase